MAKYLWEKFLATMFPIRDEAAAEVIERHGGWLNLLAPEVEPPAALVGELEELDYSGHEIKAMKLVIGPVNRDRWILEAAAMKAKLGSTISHDLREYSLERVFPKITEYEITDAEIEHAAKNWLPHVERWGMLKS